MANSSKKFTVKEEDNEVRLDIFLSHHFSELSRSHIQNALKKGGVEVSCGKAKKSTLLKTDDTVTILDLSLFESKKTEFDIVPEEMELDIIFEDDYLLIINKKAGVVVHPGNGNPSGTLLNGVYHYLKGTTPRLIHRLDKDTSGVIMVAKTDKVHEEMSKLFVEREIYKGYLGFCIGRYPDESGAIVAPLGRSKIDPIKRTIRPDGRYAHTDYALIKHHCGISLLAFRLHTGRTHQIRVHSTYSGFPIMMDSFYGGLKEKVKRLEPLERPFAYKIFTPFTRQALHARYISFVHPFTNENIEITAPFHEDFRKAIEIMEVADDDLAIFNTPILNDIEIPVKEDPNEYKY